MSGASPTHKAIVWLEERGYLAGIVERRITGFVTRDWLGFADIVAEEEFNDSGIPFPLAIQVTAKSAMAAREHKIRANENYPKLKARGWRIWVMGFDPGGSKAAKVPRIVEL